ncbi:DUF1203 domain-containing protein [Streptomyces sp. NPDC059740]|uniref:DUF1203 domain-containing protein n=1 Tax=Streptomyces sp. NPDC059740 TaxID=3346926 RepID=UPI00366223E4
MDTLLHTPRTRYTPLGIAPEVLRELRERDDAGRPLKPFTATDEGSPLRCCLRPHRVGERLALVGYAPLRRWAAATGADPGAYDEVGPVFVHAGAQDCDGPEARSNGYPCTRPGAQRVLRRYDGGGAIVGGRLLTLTDAPDAGLDAALDEAFADPEVAVVHVRAVEYGCWHFEVRRG